MPAYMIASVRFTDLDKAREYGRQVQPIVLAFGGRYLARGGQAEVIEGDWEPSNVVIVEFPSLEQARRWHDSEEYRPVKAIRLEHADSQIIFVEGLPPS